MDAERAELIRQHWRRYRDMMERLLKETGYCRVPIMRPAPEIIPYPGDVPEVCEIEALEFKLERGSIDGQRAFRIVCEGLELESGKFR